ncbi:MAG: DNA polymerase IV [Bacteroidia bacterium]|nr:DNA polymerase IV [Bacteroidia bacterium]
MQREGERSILHMDLDAFFVSVERLNDSRLEGKPLIIGGTGDRGVVASCSYEARQFGVHSAMPMRMARRLCPHGIIISGDFDSYTTYSQQVTEIIREDSPLFEKASIDEFYIDLTGMERFYGCWKYAQHLGGRVLHETGLPISFGLSVNKLVSKLATGEIKPNGKLEVPAPKVSGFLAPLSVRKIPSVGKQTTQELVNMGVRTVAELRQIPRPILRRVFGKSGTSLYHKARGEDNSPVEAFSEKKSISKERTFSQDTTNIYELKSILTQMVEQLAFQLRNEQRLTACVAIKLRYANFDTVSKQKRIAYCANDEILLEKMMGMFEQLYDRRLRIRLVGIRFSHLVPGGTQISLFQDQPRQVDLYQAIDQLKSKYGSKILGRASGLQKTKGHSD